MSKRKLKEYNDDELNDLIETTCKKKPPIDDRKKHTLDSDEEDDDVNEDTYNVLPEDEIEGAEEGATGIDDEQRYTAFNMKEEMEEGHFDADGHFLWKKEKLIQDNWLDSIDWQKIHKPKDGDKKVKDKEEKGLGDESDSDSNDEDAPKEDELALYGKILGYLKPKETVAKALKRLGGTKPISSLERWKRKKAGMPEPQGAADVTKLTELANKLLTATGNMDVYQETFEQITKKVNKNKQSNDIEMDMYADDFVEKEKSKLEEPGTSTENVEEEEEKSNDITWEFKWNENDEKIHGPHSTQQMQHWVEEGYFKEGVWCRKVGQEGSFYTSKRIDFEIYY